jgi:hypothetical protein
MVRISNRCGEFPPSMMLVDVKLQGQPLKIGGFAEVFKGTHKENIVAIKRVILPDQSTIDLRHAQFVSP